MAAIITIVTGAAGTGKSYTRGVWGVLNRHWPEGRRVLTTVPVKPDVMEELYKGRSCPGIEVFKPTPGWRDGSDGPWNLPHELKDTVLIIDEAHHYFSITHKPAVRKRWGEWLGEVRHQGGRVELLTQADGKLPKETRQEAAEFVRLSTLDNQREPVTGIRFSDLQQLLASIRGRPCRVVVETTSEDHGGRRRRAGARRVIPLDPELFKCYDSYEAPIGGGISGKETELWERHSRPRVLGIVLARNAPQIAARLLLLMSFVWLFFLGGCTAAVHKVTDTFMKATMPGHRSDAAITSPADQVETAGEIDPVTRSAGSPVVLDRLIGLSSNTALFRSGVARVGENVPGTTARIMAINYARRSVVIATVGTVHQGEHFLVPLAPPKGRAGEGEGSQPKPARREAFRLPRYTHVPLEAQAHGP